MHIRAIFYQNTMPISKLIKRPERYRRWIDETVSDEEAELIRQAARRNQLTGSGRFIDEIEKKLGKRIEMRGRGRPKKEEK